MNDVTRILSQINSGNAAATNDLLPIVYEELRRIAASRLSRESPGQTLQPTALVHEAWMRLVGSGGDGWENRSHFFAAAAEAMRRILVDNARRKQRLKRGGPDAERFEIDEADRIALPIADEVLDLHEALDRFEQICPSARHHIWNIALVLALIALLACIYNAANVCVPGYRNCAREAMRQAALRSSEQCPNGFKGDFAELRNINHARCINRINGQLKAECDSEMAVCLLTCGIAGFTLPKFPPTPPGTCAPFCC